MSSNDTRPLTSSTVPRQRQSVVLQRPADDLVDGVMATDVLAHHEHRPSVRSRAARESPWI